MSWKTRQKRRKKMLENSAQRMPLRDAHLLIDISPQAGLKMSEAIMVLIDPFRDDAESADAFKSLVSMGIIAWNLSLMCDDERSEAFASAEHALSPETRLEARQLAEELIQRKLLLFPDNQRPILDYTLEMMPDGPHLIVISSLLPMNHTAFRPVATSIRFLAKWCGRMLGFFTRWIPTRS